jgi:hypothetical protein
MRILLPTYHLSNTKNKLSNIGKFFNVAKKIEQSPNTIVVKNAKALKMTVNDKNHLFDTAITSLQTMEKYYETKYEAQ